MDGSHTTLALESSGIGLGVYSPAEASRLINVPTTSLRHWMLGGPERKALWSSQHAKTFDTLLIGFRDLMEARIVHALRKSGFSLQELRGTLDYARDKIGDERPFSTRDFKTDGKEIFLDLPEGVLTVSRKHRGQRVFKDVIAPILKSIEYGEAAAELFWPQPRKRTVVLDPRVAFGKPILVQSGVPTDVIARSVSAEGSEKTTARYFDIPIQQVRDAIAFEERLSA